MSTQSDQINLGREYNTSKANPISTGNGFNTGGSMSITLRDDSVDYAQYEASPIFKNAGLNNAGTVSVSFHTDGSTSESLNIGRANVSTETVTPQLQSLAPRDSLGFSTNQLTDDTIVNYQGISVQVGTLKDMGIWNEGNVSQLMSSPVEQAQTPSAQPQTPSVQPQTVPVQPSVDIDSHLLGEYPEAASQGALEELMDAYLSEGNPNFTNIKGIADKHGISDVETFTYNSQMVAANAFAKAAAYLKGQGVDDPSDVYSDSAVTPKMIGHAFTQMIKGKSMSGFDKLVDKYLMLD